jgi:predicted GIY-YIG superfamily endonuclease
MSYSQIQHSTVVYMATNRVNGKRYIGVTARGFERRRREHEKAPKAKRTTCRYFHAAIQKYGKAVFDWAILAECETFKIGLNEEVRLTAKPWLTMGISRATWQRHRNKEVTCSSGL